MKLQQIAARLRVKWGQRKHAGSWEWWRLAIPADDRDVQRRRREARRAAEIAKREG